MAFILQLEKPTELMNSIMKDLEETRQQKTRFLLRMLPIIGTTKVCFHFHFH